MPEEQRNPEEPRKPRHIARSVEGKPKEEETKTYVVKEGQTWGSNPELQAGDTVELTEAEAAGFEDKLEPVGASKEQPSPSGGQQEQPPQQPPAPAVPKRPN